MPTIKMPEHCSRTARVKPPVMQDGYILAIVEYLYSTMNHWKMMPSVTSSECVRHTTCLKLDPPQIDGTYDTAFDAP